jgi:hypothetical protein
VLPEASSERAAAQAVAAEIAGMPSSTKVTHILEVFAERAMAAA